MYFAHLNQHESSNFTAKSKLDINFLQVSNLKTEAMKKILKSQHVLPFAAALLFVVFMASCGGGGAQQQVQEERLEEVKSEVIQDLNQLRNNIDERISVIEEEMEEAEGELLEQLELGKEALEEQRVRIDEELENVEDATLEEWENVVNRVTMVYREANEEMNTVSQNVRDWLEREEE